MLLMICALKTSLRVAGFERTWRWIQRSTEDASEATDIDGVTVAAVERAVALAAALYPGRAFCLERSLALYHYLRRRGVHVRYQMGVQTYPFGAHAWVEYRGEVINDVPEHVARYRPIEGLGT
jgi:hypothetical protein